MRAKINFPIGANISLKELESDVHPLLHHLRQHEPVTWIPAIDAWLVTRRDLAIEVMRDAKTYTVDHPGFSTSQVVGPSMLSLDGEEHRRHRSLFENPFRLREVQSRFDQPVTQHISTLLNGIVNDGRAELRRDYAGPIAVKTMITALGLDEIPIKQVLKWYDALVVSVNQVTAGGAVDSKGRDAYTKLSDHLQRSFEHTPDSSLLAAIDSKAHVDQKVLSKEQLISNAAVLLFGGIETTEGMIANAFYFLLTNPTWCERLQAEPDLASHVVEESLRLEPAAAVVDRYATRDIQLWNAMIKEGDLVRVSLTGANRDPATFPSPDQFDPLRANLRAHVTFAQGPHVCLGIHLARLEAQKALVMALAHLPKLRLASNPNSLLKAQPSGLVFRKPEALHVQWN